MPLDLNQPPVIAAVVSAGVAATVGLVVAGITQISNWVQHSRRIKTDRELAERKFSTDLDLAERKFRFDRELAKQKFAYDRGFNDHKRRVDLAEAALTDFYKARSAFRWARYSASFGNEGKTRIRGQQEDENEAAYRDSIYVPVERLNNYSEIFSRLEADKERFVANFGPDAGVYFDDIRVIRNEIISAAHSLIRAVGPGNEIRRELRDRWETAIGWDDSENDPINPRIDAAVAAMEAICRPILNPQTGA